VAGLPWAVVQRAAACHLWDLNIFVCDVVAAYYDSYQVYCLQLGAREEYRIDRKEDVSAEAGVWMRLRRAALRIYLELPNSWLRKIGDLQKSFN